MGVNDSSDVCWILESPSTCTTFTRRFGHARRSIASTLRSELREMVGEKIRAKRARKGRDKKKQKGEKKERTDGKPKKKKKE